MLTCTIRVVLSIAGIIDNDITNDGQSYICTQPQDDQQSLIDKSAILGGGGGAHYMSIFSGRHRI